jgi:ubiquinone/menaquinone biosynthesis C-methylase UbiE
LEIDDHVAALAAMGLPRMRTRAVDFGCGAGRLTQALAKHFDEAIGIDVSASMIATARKLGEHIDNLRFVENATATLAMLGDASVDLVYSNMTLQHIPTTLAEGYVDEFLRVLAPGGVGSFQFVGGPDASLRGRLYAALPNRWLNPLRRVLWRRSAVFEMHAIDESRLHAMLARHAGVRLVIAMEDRAAGEGWIGRRWIVARD